MWFIFSLIVILAWGITDLFYKKGVDKDRSLSHIEMLVAVGIVMGLHAIYFLLFKDVEYSFSNFLTYLPVASLYILAMAFGFYGFRWVDLSIGSPIENTSGAIAALLAFIFLGESITWYQALAIVVITLALILIGNEERKKDSTNEINSNEVVNKKSKKWYLVILFPILYAVIDALGTFSDAFVLDKFLTEDQANISYELTFLMVAILGLIYILVIKKKKYDIKLQKFAYLAAIFETIGQYFYVHALGSNSILVPPMIASYSAIAVLFGRITLKEKLNKKQYIAIFLILASIFVLGFEL